MASHKTRTSLWLDTAGQTLRLGVSTDGRMAWSHTETHASQRYHSTTVLPLIQSGLSRLGLTPEDVAQVGVNVGPGSFTGLRTGVTVARFWAQVTGAEVLAFSTFHLLAWRLSAGPSPEPVELWMEALRGNGYSAALCFPDPGVDWHELPACRPLPDPVPTLWTPDDAGETPDTMRQLADRYPGAFTQPWETLLPLYLQPPNITLRHAPAGG